MQPVAEKARKNIYVLRTAGNKALVRNRMICRVFITLGRRELPTTDHRRPNKEWPPEAGRAANSPDVM
jgi:hypothetical protein